MLDLHLGPNVKCVYENASFVYAQCIFCVKGIRVYTYTVSLTIQCVLLTLGVCCRHLRELRCKPTKSAHSCRQNDDSEASSSCSSEDQESDSQVVSPRVCARLRVHRCT